ncbi:MAG: GHKL domain-containing protein [Ruminococcus sp.]|nr:GHKL domain-containing protein [Ruminococcus sp.]
MSAVCYFLTYVFEALISLMYFSEKFTTKTNKSFLILGLSASVLIQFSLSFIGIPFVNLGAFLICNILLCFLLFNSSIWQSIFNAVILTITMFITELCVFYASVTFFDVALTEHTVNNTTLWIQTVCSKLLYFFVALIIAKISTEETRKRMGLLKESLLFLLPLTSIILLLGIVVITMIVDVPQIIYTVFIISTILLMYSNIVVFWVHESMVRTQQENIEYKLQKQKAEIDTEYYSLLQNQYENSNIIIHDIKRHLISVKELANHNDCDNILKYIDDLYGEYDIKYLRKYSNHKLINAIINRYMEMCKTFGIDFYCDIRDIDFSFISDANMTAILDNLLENAIEAAKDSDNKIIELTIKESNSNFVAINLENSCSTPPKKSGGELITTKTDKEVHGYGIRSIKRIAKEYNGNINYSFDEKTMTFVFTVVLNRSK